jgi:glyoxylase-like metal-dependent hydrolase (beta-lactamase superfamily II)
VTPQAHICFACGTQFPESENTPNNCPICDDDRQFVPANGQRFTNMKELRANCHNEIRRVDDGLYEIFMRPNFGIGQRAYLVQTPQGNILWDCVSLIDPGTVSALWALGGIAAIAISHPHYYTSMVEWSRAFGGIPIYTHAADRKWAARTDSANQFWEGDRLELFGGATVIRCGGHFEGGAVLHWASPAANGKGILLPGDVIQVVPDRRWVSFMYSYPNLIPLNAAAINRVVASLEPFQFDRIYGAFGHVVEEDGSQAVKRSAERYLKAIAE